ncbi:MAG TPA: hypothetical protein PLB89_04940 [Flavobacteriales bacterium]|nr:hypothetical protein [Flavobacteriales bacterium]
MSTKKFSLGKVLSITTGRLVSENHIDGVYEILNHMTGQSLFTHQLGMAMEKCKPVLLQAFPELALADLRSSNDSLDTWIAKDSTQQKTEAIKMWLVELRQLNPTIRAEYDVPTLENWEYSDPIQSAIDMVGADRVLAVQMGNGPSKSAQR